MRSSFALTCTGVMMASVIAGGMAISAAASKDSALQAPVRSAGSAAALNTAPAEHQPKQEVKPESNNQQVAPRDHCVGDLDGDNVVGVLDLLMMVSQWGPCGGCAADLTGDGRVDIYDVLILLANWGCINDHTPGNNDLCVDAILVECNSTTLGSTTGMAYNATATCGTTHTTSDVWYRIVGTGGQIEVNTCHPSSNYDTKLTVFTGSCTGLVCVGGNDDASCPHGGLLSRVTFNSQAGVTYYIMVHGFSQQTGNFGLNVICVAPVYGACCVGGSCTDNVLEQACTGSFYANQTCSQVEPCPTGGLCAGLCGGQGPPGSGCWCDNACAGFGDCCPGVCNDCPGLSHCPQAGACCVDGSCTDGTMPSQCDGIHFSGQFCASITCPTGCQYDSGTTDNSLGLTAGGVIGWAQRFSGCAEGNVLNSIATSFGTPAFPGSSGVAAGQSVGYAVMTDTGSGPGTVLWQGVGTIAGSAIDSDMPQSLPVNSGSGWPVSGPFYIVAWVQHGGGSYPAPMDSSVVMPADVWLVYTVGGTFGSFNPATATKVQMSTIGFPTVWLLRGNH
jgi:hypothetical protein